VDHGKAKVASFGREDDLPTALRARDERVAAAVMLGEKQREIGGESLAEPKKSKRGCDAPLAGIVYRIESNHGQTVTYFCT
jgi:hypothetical protein